MATNNCVDQLAPSRIPIPSANITTSGGTFTRSWSLRVKGDKTARLRPPLRTGGSGDVTDVVYVKTTPAPQQSSLRRGNSFSRISSSSGGGGPGTTARQHETTPSQRPTRLGGPKGSITPTGPSANYNSLNNRTRSLSLSLNNSASGGRLSIPQTCSAMSSPRTPPSSPSDEYAVPNNSKGARPSYRQTDWDAESITSGISGLSMASSTCDHASVARNGTTFSGRSMKYVFHCSQHAGREGDDYLTPTQRAQRQVRKLKTLLQKAQKDLESRDSDIIKLTKEVVELRLYKAALSSPEERSNSSDAVTVRENHQLDELGTPDATITNSDMTSSYTDSGHYDDYTNSSIHSKDSILYEDLNQSPYKKSRHRDVVDKGTDVNMLVRDLECEHQELVAEYEKRIQSLVRAHESDNQEQRQKHNDKIEELLSRIAEINRKYWDLVPDLDNARERIRELEGQLENALKKLDEQEERHKKVYLQLYAQGKEAVLNEQEAPPVDMASHVPSRISVSELLQQLQVTQAELENIRDIDYAQSSTATNSLQPLLSAKEAVTLWVLGARKAMYKQVMEAKHKKIDPEITLQFLKSAIYYFLTDRENSQGHLRAIQSILGFTPAEIDHIEKARAFT